jgi:4-methyl-5(b-hydroxyethyl)-thiazole monophosphate biosynthesis
MKTACVLLADGFEEVEAMTPIDYLRRAGVEVTTVGVTGPEPVGSHGIAVRADRGLEALGADYDCIVVPGGGKGAANLAASAEAAAAIKRHAIAGKLVAAICAAPVVVLHEACGLLAGKRFTCYPGLDSRAGGASFVRERVVVDGKLITARAAGCSGEFAYAIATALVGEDAADELAEKVLLF